MKVSDKPHRRTLRQLSCPASFRTSLGRAPYWSRRLLGTGRRSCAPSQRGKASTFAPDSNADEETRALLAFLKEMQDDRAAAAAWVKRIERGSPAERL